MFKRILGVFALALLCTLGWPAVASAHVLKIDGDIGAVLHINPDDNPTTGSPTDYLMSFNDDTSRFSLPKCNCKVSIIANNQTVATKPLTASSNTVSDNHYTFNKPAVYTLQFTGAPKIAGAFQPFTLNYEVRVTDGQPHAQPVPVALWVGMGMAVGLVLLAAYAIDYDDRGKA
jgi:hypothetical protein